MTDRRKSHISSRGRVGRAAPLVGLAGRTAGEAVVESLRRRRRGGDSAEFHARNAERYAEHLGHSKGVLMKAGQILSFGAVASSVDGESGNVYQRALARLQDNAPPMPYATAANVVEVELGGRPEMIFAEFDPTPLGAASIGQVHAARLHDGRRVAVKVQYPGVAQAIKADLQNTELLATFLQIAKGLSPSLIRMDAKAVAAEVSARIGDEIDYLIEAANQTTFADIYRGHPFIRIPEVVPELTTTRVLTMDLVEGRRFSEAVTADADLRNRWGENIFRFMIGTLRRRGLFNADPHPGNFLFHEDGGVTFLDFGCVKRFTLENMRHVKAMMNTAIDGDADEFVRAIDDCGFTSSGDISAADRLMWFRSGFEMYTEPQPFTFTTASAVRAAARFNPFGEHGTVIRATLVPKDYTLLTRIDVGMAALLTQLGCTGPWEAIRREWDRKGPPATAIGERDQAFWRAFV